GVAVAMGLGSYFGGLRVTEVLAEKVTRMDHAEGLSANLTTSSLVLLSGSLGLPVSTTHVSSSAIIGIGLPRLYHLPLLHQNSLTGCSPLPGTAGTVRSA